MTPEELTSVATAHQNAISRHDSEMAEIRTTLSTVSHKLDQVANQQEANAQQIALNQEAIAHLTGGILDLRNLVADSIQGHSQA